MQLRGKPVDQTEFALYFSDEAQERGVVMASVRVLDPIGARSVWSRRFGASARSYHSLSDESPVVRASWRSIADWRAEYGSDAPTSLASVLDSEVSWRAETQVHFCVSFAVVLSCRWDVFLRLWDCFLALEDDSPFLIGEPGREPEILWFTPLGEVRLAAVPYLLEPGA